MVTSMPRCGIASNTMQPVHGHALRRTATSEALRVELGHRRSGHPRRLATNTGERGGPTRCDDRHADMKREPMRASSHGTGTSLSRTDPEGQARFPMRDQAYLLEDTIFKTRWEASASREEAEASRSAEREGKPTEITQRGENRGGGQLFRRQRTNTGKRGKSVIPRKRLEKSTCLHEERC